MHPTELAQKGNARAHPDREKEAINNFWSNERVCLCVQAHVCSVDALQDKYEIAHEGLFYPQGT